MGKTGVSLALAEKLNGEIVSADSRQVYRGMNIGTDKPSLAERRGIPHYLIDVVDPDEMFTLSDYVELAWKAIAEIHARGKTPILVGSAGLYIRAVAEGFLLPQAPPLEDVRRELARRIREEGTQPLYEELRALDPEGARSLDPQNPRRLIRFYEIYAQTGKPPSALWKMRDPRAKALDVVKFGLTRDREKLYKRIAERVEAQEKAGLLDEVRGLLKKYPPTLKAFQTHSYQEVFPYLEGKISWEESKELIVRHTRQYAHRQRIWFKKEGGVHWEEAEPFGEWEMVASRLEAILKKSRPA